MPPVPVYVKGGAWTNLEDQIVKAAIQKYGTHQWSKIASLLQRKTAKQCETRWNEYLNPKLNFDEFSKEEDSRLLDLARRLPNQWRTIAYAMGRTAQVCIDRYNRLMEGAERDPELSLGSSLEFKVGDLNPKADTLAAKPDEVDLADDEREMLAEARARLLNTQGKKATRKIRERMLEESKRIAQLQKRRELKQAGIKTAIRQPRKRYATEIDYNLDVAYEQAPLAGPYDTSAEDERLAKEFQNYEKKVERRGIKNKGTAGGDGARGTKRNKSQDDIQSFGKGKGHGSVLTDEYRKPLLNLPKPGAKAAVVEQDIAIKRRKLLDSGREVAGVKIEEEQQVSTSLDIGNDLSKAKKALSLRELFASMPKPKNDFEILLDDEEEEEEEELYQDENQVSPNVPQPETRVTASSKEARIAVDLECLKIRNLPIPSFVTDIKDDFEQTFNELVATSIMHEEYLQSPSYETLLRDVEEQMKIVQIKSTAPPSAANLPSRNSLLESVQSKRTTIADLQEQLAYVTPIVSQNDKISRKLCGETLPRVRTLQHRYYVNYRMFQEEAHALKFRTERLKSDLHQLEAV